MKRHLSAIATMLLLAGCASTNPQDPYEPYNRAMYTFNDKLDRAVVKPVAEGYRKVTPSPVRSAVGNFFDNLRDVYSFASNTLRAEPEKSLNDLMRVVMNTTFGLGGLIDIATPAGLKNNKNSLGDTFASWGWKDSHYLVLPFLGPSTVRDGTATGVSLAGPGPEQLIYSNTREAVALWSLYGVSTRERLLGLEEVVDEVALDPYIFTRDAFMQMRAKQLGIEPPKQDDDDVNIDELVPSGR